MLVLPNTFVVKNEFSFHACLLTYDFGSQFPHGNPTPNTIAVMTVQSILVPKAEIRLQYHPYAYINPQVREFFLMELLYMLMKKLFLKTLLIISLFQK